MDFSYSEEQRMLTDSLRRLVADNWTRPLRRARQVTGKLDVAAWNSLVELGMGGLLVSEEFGGFGETPATMLAVHQELGRGLVSEPVISSAVMAVTLLADSDNLALKQQWLTAHAEGEAILAVAWQEEGERDAQQPLSSRASSMQGGFQLDGKKILVWHAAGSDALLVSVVLEGETAVLLVPTNSAGVTVTDFPTFDGSRAATVKFERVIVPAENLLAKGALAQAALRKALDFGIVALCAQACGAMAYLTDSTIQYLKTRKQFGQPLANFQVLQHRLGEMLIQSEMGLSMTYVATIALSEADANKRSRVVSMAKVEVAAAARFVGEASVQSHGGMGVTDELEVGDYFKRLTYLEVLLGDTNYHLQRMQDLEA
jgi:alkylation response protein AidB-like acyl-CoA dehydrogenase